MPRGGHRDGAGRKGGWKNSETQTIRVPKVFAAQLLDIAKRLDAGLPISDAEQTQHVVFDASDRNFIEEEDRSSQEIPGQMDLFSIMPEPFSESVTESKTLALQGIQLSKRLGVNKGIASKEKKRKTPEQFAEWSRRKDPDGLAWYYDEQAKLYRPLPVVDDCEDF